MKSRLSALAAACLGTAVVVASVAVGGTAAGAETPTIACDATALAQAFETGGTYQYGANCELQLGTELTLHTATSLTLESGGHHVNFVGTNIGSPFWGGNGNRFATVDGHLTLEGIVVKRFSFGASTLDGTPGSDGGKGENSCFECSEESGGGHGGNAGDGGRGGDGKDAHGGALLIDGGGVVTLEVSEFTEDFADGGRGGKGGAGGQGGLSGGHNGKEPINVPGGDAGNGGEGGRGGDAYGGAIENDGTLVAEQSRFASDIALGGTSEGGAGGEGGYAANTSVGGTGGAGGAAGRIGSAYGGAIYSTGTLTLTDTEFISDYAGYTGTSFSGSGGKGGPGGRGGPGGNGAAPGPLGLVSGGDVYSTGAFTVSGGHANGVVDPEVAVGGGGGRGGAACGRGEENNQDPNCPTNGVDGSPQPGTNPPEVRGQAVGETFVPTPNAGSGGEEKGPGSEEKGPGGEEKTGPDGGSGSGENGGSGTGGTGTGGSGSTGNGSGGNGSGSGGSGTGGSGSGSGGNGHANVGGVTSAGGAATVPVECPSSGSSCAITGELTSVEGGSAGKSSDSLRLDRRLLKAVVLGRATTTVAPGQSKVLKVELTSKGRRLLSSRRRLKVRLTVSQKIGGKETVLRSGTVRLAAHG
ncbi:MAG TPA: hypothetical protein VHZ54_14595 [Solirubrobacterales bacterium]|nr:hypothetical protein [Solirubrobacterales bacterium]